MFTFVGLCWVNKGRDVVSGQAPPRQFKDLSRKAFKGPFGVEERCSRHLETRGTEKRLSRCLWVWVKSVKH